MFIFAKVGHSIFVEMHGDLLPNLIGIAFDQREIEVNLHKATTSPSNGSPASHPFLKPT
jgi:hypothetical protein